MSSRALAALAVVAGLLFAGCIGAKDAPKAAPLNTTHLNSTVENATLPDGRGMSAGNLETNKTENGTGAVAHTHDYWRGRANVVLSKDFSFFQATPVFPDGQGSSPQSVAYIKLNQTKPDHLVYEGVTTMDVLVSAPENCPGDPASDPCAPDPNPPAMTLRYRTAAESKFVDGGAITYGSAKVINVHGKESDMPHSVASLWAWELVTDKPTQDVAEVTITIHNGGQIVNWPPHPDFYADKTERVIADKGVSVHRNGIDEDLLYGSASSWQHADKLISYGTGSLDVFINITSAKADNGAPPTGFFLEYHNATILDAEDQFNERLGDVEKKNDLQHYHFVVKVEPAGMDGPYQPESLWGFRPVAEFATLNLPDNPALNHLGLCPGCFPYDITYHMTILARKGGDQSNVMMG
ncbi:MAG: hypothetical protein QOE90_364 [Thermoplasmata archaeon]|jgi:hypothetical protein|nr:hypothetical protein [Thermoplasmata archaeon]